MAPTGDSFNAIALDEADHRAPNPMVNAGAIAVTDLVAGADSTTGSRRFDRCTSGTSDAEPEIDRDGLGVRAGDRRPQPGHRLPDARATGSSSDRVEETLDLYFAQCSVLVTAATWR